MDTTAYVFKPMKQRLTVIGMGGKEWGVVILVAIIGALLAFALGYVKTVETLSYNVSEMSSMQSDYKSEWEALTKYEEIQSSSSTNAYISESNLELAQKAIEDGISTDMSIEEVYALIPTTYQSLEPIIPDIPRWALFFFLPTIISGALQAELIHNSSIYKELKRGLKNWQNQHTFVSNPNQFMQQYETDYFKEA